MFARGVERRRIFVDDHDRRTYLRLLAQEVVRHRWRCLTYCLMENHVHLLVETPAGTLGSGMRQLHGQYAQRFNRRHDRWGHLFGGRYGSVRMDDDAQLWMTLGYIARNPVEAALARTADAWPWSSHAAILAGSTPAWLDDARLLEYLGGSGGDARGRYAECVTPTAPDVAAARPPASAPRAA